MYIILYIQNIKYYITNITLILTTITMSNNKKVIKSTAGTPSKKSFAERFQHYKATTPTNTKQTNVNICKVFDEDDNLIAFSVNGFYGARDYFLNTIKCAQLLLYLDRINALVTAGKINALQDVKYVAIDSSNPTVLISAFPPVENNTLKEDITQTFDSFIEYFTELGDPVNNGKINFNYLDDFHLRSEDEMNGFYYLSSLIQLPDRLKSATSSPKK